jgi:predicted transcriptional regulator
MTSSFSGSVLSFNQDASSLHRFIALDASQYNTPTFIERTANQNLHNYSPKDYIIIVYPALKSEAERLAAHHAEKRGLKTLVVTPQEIYNEFSENINPTPNKSKLTTSIFAPLLLANLPVKM